MIWGFYWDDRIASLKTHGTHRGIDGIEVLPFDLRLLRVDTTIPKINELPDMGQFPGWRGSEHLGTRLPKREV